MERRIWATELMAEAWRLIQKNQELNWACGGDIANEIRTTDSARGIDSPYIHCEEDENSDLKDPYDKKNKP